jgi:anti-anti-sigma factor
MENITINVDHPLLRPDSVILRIMGPIQADTLVQIDRALQAVLPAPKKKLIFDLSETGYVSNGGWAFLLTTLHRFREQGADLVLAGMNPEVHDAFELLEYDKVIRLFPTAEDALNQVSTATPNPVA